MTRRKGTASHDLMDMFKKEKVRGKQTGAVQKVQYALENKVTSSVKSITAIVPKEDSSNTNEKKAKKENKSRQKLFRHKNFFDTTPWKKEVQKAASKSTIETTLNDFQVMNNATRIVKRMEVPKDAAKELPSWNDFFDLKDL
jgi:hypothetical protein